MDYSVRIQRILEILRRRVAVLALLANLVQTTHGGSDDLAKSDNLALTYIDVSFVELDAIGHNGLPGFKPFRLIPLNSRKQPRNMTFLAI